MLLFDLQHTLIPHFVLVIGVVIFHHERGFPLVDRSIRRNTEQTCISSNALMLKTIRGKPNPFYS